MSSPNDSDISDIAKEFISCYYTTLNDRKQNMHKLYTADSIFSFTEPHPVHGSSEIQKTFDNLKGKIKVNLADGSVDALGNGKSIELLLRGIMYLDHKCYMYSQAVHLFQPHGTDSYFILYDIIRLSESAENKIAVSTGVSTKTPTKMKSTSVSTSTTPVAATTTTTASIVSPDSGKKEKKPNSPSKKNEKPKQQQHSDEVKPAITPADTIVKSSVKKVEKTTTTTTTPQSAEATEKQQQQQQQQQPVKVVKKDNNKGRDVKSNNNKQQSSSTASSSPDTSSSAPESPVTPSTYAGIVRGADTKPTTTTTTTTTGTTGTAPNNNVKPKQQRNRNKKGNGKGRKDNNNNNNNSSNAADYKPHNVNTTVVIKQLPITATDEMLKNLVKGYGDIKMIDMTRTAKGSMIAFVEFYSESSKNSILDFNGGNIVVDGVECPLHNYYPYYPGNRHGGRGELNKAANDVTRLVWSDQKPWREFAEKFEVPKKDAFDVMKTNFAYYCSNYLFISLCIGVFFFILGICCYVYIFYVMTEPIIISTHPLSRIELQLILCGSLLIIYYLFGVLDRFLYMLLICFVVCGVHSIFRQKSLKAGFTILAEDSKRHEVDSTAGVIHFSPQADIKGPNEEV